MRDVTRPDGGPRSRRAVWAWALYDWANSAFATTVMAGFFPLFFKEYWNQGVEATVSTMRLGAANSLSSLAVVLLAPLLGAVGDRGGNRKRFLLAFAALGVASTGGLYAVARGDWALAAVLYTLGAVGFAAGNTFYDSLLVGIAHGARFDRVSSLGFGLGYLGGGLLFALNVFMTLRPGVFGLADAAEAVRVSFLTVAAWWAVFSVPVFAFVPEPRAAPGKAGRGAVTAGLRELAETFREVRRYRVVFTFLVGYWLYIDGVDTIVRMAVDYGLSLGLRRESLITALLLTQFVGFPSALVFGRVGERLGPKTGVLIGLTVYLGVTVWGAYMDSAAEFYALAVTIGLVQGGVQALSRSLYARLIPSAKSGEFFGFFNMMGKFAAVLGPVLMGWAGVITGSSRASILVVAALILGGMVFLWLVDPDEGERAAREEG